MTVSGRYHLPSLTDFLPRQLSDAAVVGSNVLLVNHNLIPFALSSYDARDSITQTMLMVEPQLEILAYRTVGETNSGRVMASGQGISELLAGPRAKYEAEPRLFLG
jgi:hypothetical protein